MSDIMIRGDFPFCYKASCENGSATIESDGSLTISDGIPKIKLKRRPSRLGLVELVDGMKVYVSGIFGDCVEVDGVLYVVEGAES